MRELSGRKKKSDKSGHKRSEAKHKSKARRHDESRGHAHASGARGEGGRTDHGRAAHAHGHHTSHHVDMSRIEHQIVRGINLLGLLVEWGLNRNFRAGQPGGAAPHPQQAHHGQAQGANAGWAAPGGGAGWQGRNPSPPPPPPPNPGYSGSIASGRIVVCTGKNCRARWESGNLVADLQREAAMRGVQVEVTTCGCMDFCDEAPLVTVGGRGGAGGSSERYFADVGSRDVPNIVASAMSWRG